MFILRQSIFFVRFAFPHALRLFFSSLWGALILVAFAIASLFRGVWPTAVRLAEHWVEEALAHGFPSLWERNLRATFRILATLTILTGWAIILVSGYITADYAYNALLY